MKRQLIIIFLLFPAVAFAQHSIEGVWTLIPGAIGAPGRIEEHLSWGSRMYPPATHIIVDLHSEPPIIDVRQFTIEEIISIDERGNETEIRFHFGRGGFDVAVIFHFNEDGTMWIEPIEGESGFWATGPDRIYHKLDGPEFDPALDTERRALGFERTNTIDRALPLRERADASSPVIKTLPAGSDIWLLESFTNRARFPWIICIVPCYNGASAKEREKLWDKYYTAAPERLRRPVEKYKTVKRA